jgi:hypothetical protein
MKRTHEFHFHFTCTIITSLLRQEKEEKKNEKEDGRKRLGVRVGVGEATLFVLRVTTMMYTGEHTDRMGEKDGR